MSGKGISLQAAFTSTQIWKQFFQSLVTVLMRLWKIGKYSIQRKINESASSPLLRSLYTSMLTLLSPTWLNFDKPDGMFALLVCV